MTAYEFYLQDSEEGDHLVGILPERRKDPSRITPESVTRWAETVLGNSLNINGIYYVRVQINDHTGWILRPTPPV